MSENLAVTTSDHPTDATTPADTGGAVVAMPEWAAELLAGGSLAHYRLREAVAANERAAMFKADDQRLERAVALKVLRPAGVPPPAAVENFFDEARAVARVRQPGRLVRALDVGRAGPYFFYAMQWLRGDSLADRLARRERPRWYEREALAFVRDAAEALRALFEEGLVHRRLAPGNFLYDDNAKAWTLAEVGCQTEIVHGDVAALARARPDYAAPELCAGELNVDIRADLYSLGALWHLLLLGEPPFPAASADEMMRAHLEAAPVAPRDRDERISPASSRLILWLLGKEREDRPRSPKDFLARLSRHPLLADAADNDAPGDIAGETTPSAETIPSPAAEPATGTIGTVEAVEEIPVAEADEKIVTAPLAGESTIVPPVFLRRKKRRFYPFPPRSFRRTAHRRSICGMK